MPSWLDLLLAQPNTFSGTLTRDDSVNHGIRNDAVHAVDANGEQEQIRAKIAYETAGFFV